MSDLISRADAIEAVRSVIRKEWLLREAIVTDIEALPSADAVPTVIRAKTFMCKEDFDKLAEDIKKQNKSIVCIPCDAEVVSADAVHGEWIWRTDIPIGDGRTSAGYICSNCGKDYVM